MNGKLDVMVGRGVKKLDVALINKGLASDMDKLFLTIAVNTPLNPP